MNELQQEIGKILTVIEKGQNFLVMGHKSVDGDAYGSSMALYFYLQSIGKDVEVINELPITPLFHFLDVHTEVHKAIKGTQFDAIFICDCGEFSLIGKYPELYPDIFKDTPIVNIDHHNGNVLFGNYNLVDTKSSSTSEMLFDLLEASHQKITLQVATLLLFGIIHDTNCFRNSIRPHTFDVTSKLMVLEAEYDNIIFHTYKSEKLNYLRLYGHILENLISLKGGTIMGGVITQEIFQRYGIHEKELGQKFISQTMTSIDGTDFIFLIKETETGGKNISFRARRDGFDVSKIAKHLGGGGHICSARGYSNESIEEILKVIEEMDVRI